MLYQARSSSWGAKNVLMDNREAGSENRADGPTGSICCFTPVLPTEEDGVRKAKVRAALA
jgi:hypothetical protein